MLRKVTYWPLQTSLLCSGKAHVNVMNQTVQLSMTIDYTDFFEVLTAPFI
jgi:hypothetical protein